MTDKQIIIDVCPYQGECSVSGCKRNDDGCFVRQLFEERYRAENQIVELNKTIKAKEQECKEKSWEIGNLGYKIKNQRKEINIRLEQLDRLKAENKELKKVNIHIDNNRMVKADKLKRIEDLIIACSCGYTDEFIQELLVILHEPEPIKE